MAAAAISKELRTASEETLCQAQEHLDELELRISQSMVYLRDPLEPWIGTHPHWLHRIAHVKASSYYQKRHVARSAITAGLVHKSRNDGQAMLQAYHASSEWPALVKKLSCDLPDDLPKFKYSGMALARKWSQGDVIFYTEKQAAREFDCDISDLAVIHSVCSKLGFNSEVWDNILIPQPKTDVGGSSSVHVLHVRPCQGDFSLLELVCTR